MELTRLQRREVVDGDGQHVGTVVDVAVSLAETYPAATHILVRTAPRSTVAIPWSQVRTVGETCVELRVAGVRLPGEPLPDDTLLLGRDVLDTQVFDLAGKRLARVGDVRLEEDQGTLRAVGVEVGSGAVMRRLGLARLARRRHEDPIAWTDLHLASARGHTLALATQTARRLTSADLAELLGHLPTGRGAALLEGLPPRVAADALSHSRPHMGARLVRAIAPHRAASILAEMAGDDATAALRHLSASDLDALLGHLDSARARQLRRLLAHPVRTAGGLMNPDVITAGAGETLDAIRARIAAHPPRLDALLTVFFVDDDGRPTGAVSPIGLLTAAPRPLPTPIVRQSAPVAEVVDIFALHDVLAVPVVDDEGRLIGVIAVDDVFEELLAERLPARRRYRSFRRRGR